MRMKKDNRGATLVLTIVVLAIVGVMGATSLFMSVKNFQMKKTDQSVKDSFYTAESLLGYLKAGLRKDVSDSYEAAMKFALQNYFDPAEAGEVNLKDQKGRFDSFRFTFLSNFVGKLTNNPNLDLADITSGNGGTYDLQKLIRFLPNDLVNNAATEVRPYVTLATPTSPSRFKQSAEGIVLEKLTLKYVDEKDFVSIIETDILIKTPPLDFKNASSLPAIFKYVVVGNKGVEVKEHANVKFEGSVYAGSPFVIQQDENSTESKSSFVLKGCATAKFFQNTKLIAEGDTVVRSKVSDGLNFENNSELWTENLIIERGKLRFGGRAYVADDLTLKGHSPDVSFSSGARYYGYGYSKEVTNEKLMMAASESSSILVNGKGSSLDLSGLDALLLNGYAYIGTSKKNDSSGIGSASAGIDIRMGESIAVKGNQVAYLVPAEWIGVHKTTKKSLYYKNPLSYEEYANLVRLTQPSTTAGGVQVEAEYSEIGLDVTSSRLEHDFSYYGGESKYVSKLFVPANRSVYFYVNLPYREASMFFKDYVSTMRGSSEIKDYSHFYATALTLLNDKAQVETAGGYANPNAPNLVQYVDPLKSHALDFKDDFPSMFLALSRKLVTDINQLNPAEKKELLFYNVLDKAKLNTLTGLREVVVNDGAANYRAVITKGDYSYSGADPNIRLIIAEGNVTVTGNFKGTIIAKGKVNLSGGFSMKADDTGIIKQLLRESLDPANPDGEKLYELFKDGKYLIGVSSDDGNNAHNLESVDNLIIYDKWKKK